VKKKKRFWGHGSIKRWRIINSLSFYVFCWSLLLINGRMQNG
jgi:hypothetical protein